MNIVDSSKVNAIGSQFPKMIGLTRSADFHPLLVVFRPAGVKNNQQKEKVPQTEEPPRLP
jgi:hypothetical protein